jgi:predicted transcriptional regulator
MLQTIHFVSEDGERVYYLTAIGKNMVRKLIDLIGDTEVIVEHEKFWIEHDLSGIPDQLFDRIGALRDSTLVADTKRDPLTAYHSFVAFLEKSSTVELIASVNAPDPHFLYDEFVVGHKHIELVVTESVLHHVIEELGQVRVKEACSC